MTFISISTNEIVYNILSHPLRGYRFPRNKIRNLLQSGELIRVKKGIYVKSEPNSDSQAIGLSSKDLTWHHLGVWALAKLITLDIEAVKRDIERLVPDQRTIAGWSRELFVSAIERVTS